MLEQTPGNQAPNFRPLDASDVLDLQTERELGKIVCQAAAAIGTAMALVSLVDQGRQVLKAKVGIDLYPTFSTSSLCAHAMRGVGVFVIPDAALDPRFASNLLVTERPVICFYAGAALNLDGVRAGTICILDDQPRRSLSSLHERFLSHLADRTSTALKHAQ